ncbi:hypothetical protein EXE41_17080 [Halorubrum sp. SD690R]|nr:hypothetical protein EXE41_17080 [Halorubrum sp. SD690R]
MPEHYEESSLDIGANRWYAARFFRSYYDQEKDWGAVKQPHETTAAITESLIDAFLDEQVFGDPELTALQSLVQTSGTIGIEKTGERIQETRLSAERKETIVSQIESADTVGIVGGTAYRATVPDEETEATLLEIFSTLRDKTVTVEARDTAVKELLALDLGNVGLGTTSPVLCLLFPTRYPIVNAQTETTLAACLGRKIPSTSSEYFATVDLFTEVRDELGFREHFRHLDNFCYWANSQTEIVDWLNAHNISDRVALVADVDAGADDPESAWAAWQDNAVWTTPDSAVAASSQENSSSTGISPGTLLVAVYDDHVLGIGVTDSTAKAVESTDTGSLENTQVPVEWCLTFSEAPQTLSDLGIKIENADAGAPDQIRSFEKLRWQLLQQEVASPAELFTIETVVAHTRADSIEDRDIDATDKSDTTGGESGGTPTQIDRSETDTPRVWIEKSDHSRPDRSEDGWGVGEALWCPQRKTNGTQSVYSTKMEEIMPGDIVLLLDQDERAFTGFARAASQCRESYCLEGTSWDEDGVSEMGLEPGQRDAYKIELEAYHEFATHLPVNDVLNTTYEDRLYPLADGDEYNVVFNRNLNLNQGAYLTDAPNSFTAVINDALAAADLTQLPLNIDKEDDDTNTETSADRLEAAASGLEHVSFSIPSHLYYDDADRIRRQIEAALNSGKSIIFTGPPGTGKTELATALGATGATQDAVDDFVFTTATADWSSFDTIGGHVPAANGDGIEFQPRIFLNCFREDSSSGGDPGQIVNKWLVIDEINRSDIDKAFGQLFSVLSGDSVELPYERTNQVEIRWVDETTSIDTIAANPDIFPVTPAWRLIGTMNTHDKASLYEMSYAFMRRFSFIHIPVPELETDEGIRTELLSPAKTENFATAWEMESLLGTDDLYQEIAVLWYQINQHRKIGPSIIMDILRYVDAYDATYREDALTDAVVSLVYPQLEGMRPDALRKLLGSLTDGEATTDGETIAPSVDEQELLDRGEDFFGMPLRDDDG